MYVIVAVICFGGVFEGVYRTEAEFMGQYDSNLTPTRLVLQRTAVK